MNNADVLIIGAGAAGLMAARILAKAGKEVIVLEARERCGGRIHTLYNEAFFKQAELGAEFVHGDLPVTLGLLNEASIPYYPAAAEMWQYKKGKFTKENEFIEGWDMLMKKLEKLKSDISIAGFLEKEFAGDKYTELKKSVKRFVSGYDTAEPEKASTFALRKEWQSEDEGAQHRIKGGYGAMIKYLEDECKQYGGVVYLNSVVKEINWSFNDVKVITDGCTQYRAKKILIAVPLGILQAEGEGSITFNPSIPKQMGAIQTMGFGAIIKILLEFEELFWEDKSAEALAGKSLKGMGFLLSDERIPTWWTQVPQCSQVLTGWLGGLAANEMKDLPEEEILEIALQSLSNIFKRSVDELKDMLVAFNIVNWTTEPFTLGSYAYDTIGADKARKILNNSIDNTLFFAGEYLYEGTAMGTVEAALTSGKDAAERLLSHSQ